jgi:GTP-binding protein HflX
MEDADLLIQVVDASDPDRDQQIRAVEGILSDLGLGDKPRILVWNKADRLSSDEAEHLAGHGEGGFVVSALDPATFGPLLLAIERSLWHQGRDLPVARTAHA